MSSNKKAKQVKGNNVTVMREVRLLKCTLTADEVAEQAQVLAREIAALNETEKQLDAIKSEFKAKTGKSEAIIQSASRLVRDKSEHRSVECEASYDYDDLTVKITRIDTGEIVEDRPMTYGERQMSMDFDGKADKPNSEKEPEMATTILP